MPFCSNCGVALPSGARFCPRCAEPVSHDRPSEERKLATVLFADLVGSTELADSQDAERTRALLNRFYDAMASEIAHAGGTVEKFIGDAVLAAFGAPASQEDHADRALHAALAMRHALGDLFGDALRLRIGINTGDVVVGEPRVGSSFVTGDAVNVAARLEQAANPGEILVGKRTVSVLRSAFQFGPETTIEAKGKPGGVVCRRLRGGGARGEAIAARPATFVGRESELEALQTAYARVVRECRPSFVTVVGEPGIGKSRLVREFRNWLRNADPTPLQRAGRCRAFGQASAYSPLGEVVHEHPEVLDRCPILGVTLGQPAPPGLHPLAVREQLRAAWVALSEELVAGGPAVLLMEDLHWAEPELIELLEQGRDIQGPLLVLGTARDELGRGDEPIMLDALTSAEAGRMVDRLASGSFAADVRAFVIDRSDGNPLFVEELLRMLVDQGISSAIPLDLVVPDTVQAVLAARIDSLEPGDKSALQAAAVIGRTFGLAPVRELTEREANFDALAGRGFVVGGESGFMFTHGLTRDVAYGSLTTSTRARLHARYAGWLETEGGGRDEDAAELAHHYGEAVRPEDVDLAWPGEEDEVARLGARAVRWLRRAAALAAGRYEMKDAVSLLERAIELEADPRAQVEIWQEIARANVLYFDGKAFAAALQEAIALADGDVAAADLYAELAFQTVARAGMWGTPPPSDLVDGWIARTLELAPDAGPARAKALIARCYSDYDKSLGDAAEACEIADRLQDPVLRSLGYDVRGLVAFVRSEYREALDWCRRCVSLVGDLDDPDTEAYTYADAVNPAVACGEFAEARSYAVRQDDVTRSLSPHHRLHGVSGPLELEELLGSWADALGLQQEVEWAVAENVATPCVRNARSLLVCALAHAYLGDEEEAERLERQAEGQAMSGYGTVLDTPRLQLALHRGDLSAVESLLGEPAVRRANWFYLSSMAARLDGLAALGDRERVEKDAPEVLQPRTYLDPFARRALGIVRQDEALIAGAADRFEALALDWHATRTRALL